MAIPKVWVSVLHYDPDAAKALLAEAGYPDGFSFGLQCSNDRYINDESICKAAASMMAKVGLNARLSQHAGAQLLARIA